jgi:hypothetical protein
MTASLRGTAFADRQLLERDMVFMVPEEMHHFFPELRFVDACFDLLNPNF